MSAWVELQTSMTACMHALQGKVPIRPINLHMLMQDAMLEDGDGGGTHRTATAMPAPGTAPLQQQMAPSKVAAAAAARPATPTTGT